MKAHTKLCMVSSLSAHSHDMKPTHSSFNRRKTSQNLFDNLLCDGAKWMAPEGLDA